MRDDPSTIGYWTTRTFWLTEEHAQVKNLYLVETNRELHSNNRADGSSCPGSVLYSQPGKLRAEPWQRVAGFSGPTGRERGDRIRGAFPACVAGFGHAVRRLIG